MIKKYYKITLAMFSLYMRYTTIRIIYFIDYYSGLYRQNNTTNALHQLRDFQE